MRTLRMMALAAPMLATLACRDLTTAPPKETAVAKVGALAAGSELPILLQIRVSNPSHVTIRSTGANAGVDFDGSSSVPQINAYDGVVLSTFFTSPIRQFVGLYVNSPVQYVPGPTNGNLGLPSVSGLPLPLNELYSTDFFGGYGHGGRDLGIFPNDGHGPLTFFTASPAFIAAGLPGRVEAWFNSTVVDAITEVSGSLPSVGSTGDILAGWAEGQGPAIGRWEVVSSPAEVKEWVLARINAAIPGAAKEDRDKLAEAAKRLASSLTPALWIDDSHLDPKRGERVFEDEKEATQKLAELRKSKKSGLADATLANWIRLLVADDRELAQTAITDAAAGDQKSLAEAAKELAKGDAEGSAGRANSAIEHYKIAWKKAQEALKH